MTSANPSTVTVDEALELWDAIATLTNRVIDLEAQLQARPGRKPRPHDALDARILAFLADHPALRFNGGTIAENLGEDVNTVSSRVIALGDAGRVESEKRDGKVRVYWHKQPAAPALRSIGGAE